MLLLQMFSGGSFQAVRWVSALWPMKKLMESGKPIRSKKHGLPLYFVVTNGLIISSKTWDFFLTLSRFFSFSPFFFGGELQDSWKEI